jgi:Asp-tRNA(Asn)/Glu-tRNA(Gln) amidotransferase A subunit family amidase
MRTTRQSNQSGSSRSDAGSTSGSTRPGLLGRRGFLELFSVLGLGGSIGPRLRAQTATEKKISTAMIAEAEKLAGLEFTDTQRELMVDGVNENLERYKALRKLKIPNQVPPAYHFDPVVPGIEVKVEQAQRSLRLTRPVVPPVPKDLEELAFLPVTQLSELIRRRLVSSVDLTTMYLSRLKKYDPALQCVITLCEDLAMKQARRADHEIASGTYRGPLHGIPWGAKDLLSVKEYRTTWGAAPYRDQVIHEDATVVTRLEEAGAVLVAKLSLGETARGETWFGGMTRNPWNLEEGASGSSAGPAAATAAGLVAFSIGSDTRGSIVLPCDRCGATGLRPTFGTVSRHGAMVLAWTMDKLGPICRSVEDCVIVLHAIRGPDGKDQTVRSVPFDWDSDVSVARLRVGYVKSAFARDYRGKASDEDTLKALGRLGVDLVPIEMPEFPVQALRLIMDAETGAAFDELVLSGQADLLARQGKGDRPNNLRHSRLIPAVEYIQANRARTILLGKMAEVMQNVDVFVAPSLSDAVLMLTNLTGHPCVVVPNGFTDKGTPTTICFVGGLFKDAQTALLAHRYQQATDFHLRHPNLAVAPRAPVRL